MTASKNEGSFQGERGLQNLRSNLLDFLFAGSETTSTALNWSMLLMAKYGDIQTQVQQELDNICGRERLPSATDRPNLHYTEAVCMYVCMCIYLLFKRYYTFLIREISPNCST